MAGGPHVVERYELNEVAQDMPNFGDPKSFSVLSLGERQGHAVECWRAAADHLHPLWSAYRKLAASHGHLLGPVESTDVSTNMFTACVLGDPGTFGRTEAAATQLARIAAGVDAVKPYAAISPFIAPALTSYELRLHTLEDAATIRRRVQNI